MANAPGSAPVALDPRKIAEMAALNRSKMDANRAHPFLTGIHTPMTEERTLTDLAVTGTIPPELSGRYVRIGPNPFQPDPRGYHWFAGDGMVHGVRLQGGRALWYRNRYIRSMALASKGGPEAAPGPRRGRRDLVNTNVIQHAGKTLAIVEAGSYPAELTEELETRAYTDFGGTLHVSFSAHPHRDPKTGELHAITYDGMTHHTVWHVVVSPEGRVVREEPIPVEHGPSIHECSLTERYVIVFDLPVTFSMPALLGGQQFPYRWNPQHPARVGLLPRQGRADEIVWCEVDPCYVFHVANSYETPDGKVIIDSSVHDTMFAEGDDGPNGRVLGMERWTVDPVARKVTRTTIDSAPQEFHRPDERFFGQPYRHAWSLGLPQRAESGMVGTAPIYHYDLVSGERTMHDFGPDAVPGEFVFVPRHAQAAEGEGWLMGYVIDRARDTTDLVILDAMNLGAEPVARVHLPHRVPPGFHGNWLPDEA